MEKKFQSIIIIFFLFFAGAVLAQVASSTNYMLVQDSLNSGGVYSSSTDYGIEDTTGEVGTGYSSSTNYLVQAGYQQTRDEGFISIYLSGTSVGLGPAIITNAGGSASGEIQVGVLTDSQSGYTLSISASSYNPTLNCSTCSGSGHSYFKDYYPAVSGTPDFAWISPVATSSFGFTAEGIDISSYFRDNGSICGAGNNDSSDTCWYGFDYSAYSSRALALRNLPNDPLVSTTTVKLKTESSASNLMNAGSYSANLTVTAIAN
jgi:hypothetical protein